MRPAGGHRLRVVINGGHPSRQFSAIAFAPARADRAMGQNYTVGQTLRSG
jgi:hypothetical protein